MKFGGSCLRSADDMSNASRIISRYRYPVVIASAMNGVTQKLIELSEAEDAKKHRQLLEDIGKAHRNTITGLADTSVRIEASDELEAMLQALERSHSEWISGHEPWEKAYLLSFGERLSAVILKWYLRDMGLKSSNINSDELLFAEDDNVLNATVDEEISQVEIRNRIAFHSDMNEIPVVTGFFCCSLSGRTALLGRNSSDYTASMVAYSLPTYELVFWKDVPGLMTGDPKLVKESHVLKLLTYEQAGNYIVNGAKILHPRVIDIARKRDTTIRIKPFREPEAEGTLITGAIPSVEIS